MIVRPAQALALPARFRTLDPGDLLRVRDHLGPGDQLASIGGGTHAVSGFAGSAPNTPVWAGELSAPHLGVAPAAHGTEGFPVVDRAGELVVTAPCR